MSASWRTNRQNTCYRFWTILSLVDDPWGWQNSSHTLIILCWQETCPAMGFSGGSVVKNPSAMPETWVWSMEREDSPEEGIVTHSSILAWRTPWTEEPGVHYTGLLRVGRDWATKDTHTCWLLIWYLWFWKELTHATTHPQKEVILVANRIKGMWMSSMRKSPISLPNG